MAIPPHIQSQIAAHRLLRPDRDSRGRLKRGHGVRSRVPRQERPLRVEAGYASAIWSAIDVRDVLHPLLSELPELLKTASASRADEADYPEPIRRTVNGVLVDIENPAGTTREWVDSDGTAGSTVMAWDYGELVGYIGADGEPVDVYVGPNEDSPVAFVVRQMSKASGFTEYDEDKVMLGWDSRQAAAAAYVAQYSDPRFLGEIFAIPLDVLLMQLGMRAQDGAIDKPTVASLERADAGESGRVRAMIDRARKALGDRMNVKGLEDLAARYGQATSNFQRAQLGRQVRAALGIDLVTGDRKLPTLMDHFVGENVSLIKSLGNRTLDDVEKIVTRAFTSGRRASDVADDIQDRYDVSERHARLIARDQIGKLNGQVNAARQQELGIDRFTWRTVGDERVRDEHRELNGQVFAYDDPPDEGIPGEPINCRCSAEPYFSDMLDELSGEGREASGKGEEGGADDESGDEVDREDWLLRWFRLDYSDDQPRDEHGRFGSGGGGAPAKDQQADARATSPKPGESPEQHARRMAINAASRASKAKARAAAKASLAPSSGPPAAAAPVAPAPAPAAPPAAPPPVAAPAAASAPAAPQTRAVATAPKPGESPEQHAARLARNEASRVAKANQRAAARAAAMGQAAPAPTPAAPPAAAPTIAPAPPPPPSSHQSAPKPGETPEQHAARMARNAASRASKAKARATALGQAPAPSSRPAANKPPTKDLVDAPGGMGYVVNAAVPESGPRATPQTFSKAADAYAKIRDMPIGGRGSPRPKDQKAVRQHLHEVLSPYGLHKADKDDGSGARLQVRKLSGARGQHRSDGLISISTPVARNAAQFLHDQKNGVDYASKLAGANATGVVGYVPYGSHKSETAELAERANDYRTHVHEALHGYGPRSMLSRSYAREGVIVEEVSTEVSARKVVRDQVGLKHGDVRALSAPTHRGDSGSYTPEIYSATSALREAVTEGSHDPNVGGVHVSHAHAYEALERASLRYKSMPTHHDANTPDGSVRMFSNAIDFDHLEKLGGRKLSSDQRAKISATFAKKLTDLGHGKLVY